MPQQQRGRRTQRSSQSPITQWPRWKLFGHLSKHQKAERDTSTRFKEQCNPKRWNGNTHFIDDTLADVDESKNYSMKAEEHIVGIHRNNSVWIFLQELLLYSVIFIQNFSNIMLLKNQVSLWKVYSWKSNRNGVTVFFAKKVYYYTICLKII